MLTSQLGIRLILLIGQTVPLPASYEIMKAISQIQVTNDADSGDGFQITFTMSKDKTAEYNLLQSGAVDLFSRVIIAVVLGAVPEVLIDGIITHHQVTPSQQPGMTTLTVTGRDVSIMMDLEEKNQKFENQPDFVIFSRLIANYAQYGLIPNPTPTTYIPLVVEQTPWQYETDLKFIQRMAERNGFVFYIEPVTFQVNKAYFGPENRLGLPQPALSMNMGSWSNVNSLNFSQDGLAPVSTFGTIVEPTTKQEIQIPSLPSLKVPPLARTPTPAKRKVAQRQISNENPGQAVTTEVAAKTRAPDSVTGSGDLDTVRYGSVLRARQLVGVRGVGLSYDGLYWVRSVTHTLAPGQFKQSFSLSREGTGSLLPIVRVS